MTTVTFIEPGGRIRQIAVEAGENLMVAATRASVEGIVGECGGSAMCATCHCYLEAGVLPPPEPLEAETIEFVARNIRPESRLACQIKAGDAVDGLVLRVAAR